MRLLNSKMNDLLKYSTKPIGDRKTPVIGKTNGEYATTKALAVGSPIYSTEWLSIHLNKITERWRPSESFLCLNMRLAGAVDPATITALVPAGVPYATGFEPAPTCHFALINDLRNLISGLRLTIDNQVIEQYASDFHVINYLRNMIQSTDIRKSTYGEMYGDYTHLGDKLRNTDGVFQFMADLVADEKARLAAAAPALPMTSFDISNIHPPNRQMTSLEQRIMDAAVVSTDVSGTAQLRVRIPLTHIFSFFEQNDKLFDNCSVKIEMQFCPPSSYLVTAQAVAANADGPAISAAQVTAARSHRLVWGDNGGCFIKTKHINLLPSEAAKHEDEILASVQVPKVFEWLDPEINMHAAGSSLNGYHVFSVDPGRLDKAFLLFQLDNQKLATNIHSELDIFTGLGLTTLQFKYNNDFIPLEHYTMNLPHNAVAGKTAVPTPAHNDGGAYNDFLSVVSKSTSYNFPTNCSYYKWINGPIFAYDLAEHTSVMASADKTNNIMVKWTSNAGGLSAWTMYLVTFKYKNIALNMKTGKLVGKDDPS